VALLCHALQVPAAAASSRHHPGGCQAAAGDPAVLPRAESCCHPSGETCLHLVPYAAAAMHTCNDASHPPSAASPNAMGSLLCHCESQCTDTSRLLTAACLQGTWRSVLATRELQRRRTCHLAAVKIQSRWRAHQVCGVAALLAGQVSCASAISEHGGAWPGEGGSCKEAVCCCPGPGPVAWLCHAVQVSAAAASSHHHSGSCQAAACHPAVPPRAACYGRHSGMGGLLLLKLSRMNARVMIQAFAATFLCRQPGAVSSLCESCSAGTLATWQL
jgi:hypothetical protein